MGKWLTEGVDLLHRTDGETAVLQQTVAYQCDGGRIYRAYPGLITDGRSGQIGYYVIGQPFRTKHLRAAMVHDWQCAKAKLLDPGPQRDGMRKAADRLFRDETLPACGVGRVKRLVMYRAVRLHAWYHRKDAVPHWSQDFVSEDASHAGAGE